MNGLLQPWNLIFVLPFVCALLLLLLTCLGLLPDGHDGDASLGEAGDLQPGEFQTGHVPAGGDHAAVDLHDTHVDVDGDGDLDDAPFWQGLLVLIGFGRVPASLLLMCFGFFWGFAGWSSNQVLGAWLPPIVFIWPSLLIATVASGALTRSVASTVSRFLPSSESYGVSGFELAGKTAKVRYRITEKSGTAQLYDRHGNLHEVSCRIAPGGEEILNGEEVLLVTFEEDDGFYRVIRKPCELHVKGLHERALHVTERTTRSHPLPPSAGTENVSTESEAGNVIEGEV